MKKSICFAIISLVCFSNLVGQKFQFKGNNLFGLEMLSKDSTQSALKLLFYDVDADGDQDVIVTGVDSIDNSGDFSFDKIKYFIAVQENIGDRWHPSFAPRKSFMDSFPYPNGYFYPAIGDLNHDGKPDLIVSSGVDSFLNLQTLYYERKSLSGNNQFNIIGADSWDLDAFIVGSFFVPELADMDMDGDMDLLMSGFISRRDTTNSNVQIPIFMYAVNTGTITQPNFLGWYQNPYGLTPPKDQIQMSILGDIDNDNDNDILSLTLVDNFTVFAFLKNNSLPTGKPNFQPGLTSPFGLPKAGSQESLLPPSLVDIDGDGDLDLFAVQKLKNNGEGIGYYENNLCVNNLTNISRNICSNDSVKIGNQVFKTQGEYYVIIEKSNHCDSTVHLNLTVLPSSAKNIDRTICQGEVTSIGNQSFTQSGKYQVKLNSSNGCDSIVNLNLSVNPSVTTNLVKSLCQGEVFSIGNQSYNQTGQYQVKLISAKGCDSIVNATLNFIILNKTVTQTQSGFIADLIGMQYQWFDCASNTDISGATQRSFQPTKSGKYGVKLTDASGCKGVSDCYNFVLSATDDQKIAKKITIYPNPTDDYFTILNSTGYHITSINIINSVGMIVKTITKIQADRISTADLPAGNYIVEINSVDWKISKKLSLIKD